MSFRLILEQIHVRYIVHQIIVTNINPLKVGWLIILRINVGFLCFYEVNFESRREPLLLNAEQNCNMKTIIALV